MNDALETVAGLARHLPPAAVRTLGLAVGEGPGGLQHHRAQAASTAVRTACDRLAELLRDGFDAQFLAGALAAAGRAEQQQRRSSIEIVWTGPDSGHASTRLTLAVVTDLVATADHELLLVSYAAHSDPHLTAALEAAASRGVAITLLLERHEDNPAYASWAIPFPSLDATRLAWPAANRTPGAAMHAKILVVDEHTVLIGSANLTSNAMERNLECGVVIQGHDAARAIRRHIALLRDQGILHAG